MSGATVRGVAETLTEKEALTLEAIARGENPCARIGEENTSITGTRRRLVTGLRKKGMVGPDSPNGGMPASENTWNPPESVRIGRSHAANLWRPPMWPITSMPGRRYR